MSEVCALLVQLKFWHAICKFVASTPTAVRR